MCVQGKLIGQGSFGSVYLGIDLHTGKEVRAALLTAAAPVGRRLLCETAWQSMTRLFMCCLLNKQPSDHARSFFLLLPGGHQGDAQAAREAVPRPHTAKAGQGGALLLFDWVLGVSEQLGFAVGIRQHRQRTVLGVHRVARPSSPSWGQLSR